MTTESNINVNLTRVKYQVKQTNNQPVTKEEKQPHGQDNSAQ